MNGHGNAGSVESTRPLPRVVIADDEEPARNALRDFLQEDGRVQIVGEAPSGSEALRLCTELTPDLAFLDIRMPDGSGMDVARELTEKEADPPFLVFVTAYDNYAVEAFELAAADYLVKPYDQSRLSATLDRVLPRIPVRRGQAIAAEPHVGPLPEATVEGPKALDEASGRAEEGSSPFLERVGIESRGTISIVAVSEVDYITSDGNYVELVVGTRRHLMRGGLSALQRRLNPSHFCRIHRSTLVRLDRIESVRRRRSGDCVVMLKTGIELKASRTHRDELAAALGISL